MIGNVIRLLGFRLQTLPRRWRTLETGRRLLFVPFGLIFLGFEAGLYFIAWRVLDFLNAQGAVGAAILLQGISIFLNTLFFLLISSTAVAAVTTLFRNQETTWLFGLPLSPLAIFIYKSIESLVYSTWMVVVLALPIFVALFQVLGLTIWPILLALAGLIGLLLLAGALGVAVTLIMTRIVAMRPGLAKWLILLAFVGIGWLLMQRQSVATGLLPDLSNFNAIASYLDDLRSTSPWLPGSWLAIALRAAQEGNLKDTAHWVGLIWVNAAFAWQLLYMVSSKVYLHLWWLSEDQQGQSFSRRQRHLLRLPVWSKTLALFEKDIKLFLRNPRQWLQSVFLLSMFGFFLLILQQVPARFEVLQHLYATLIAYLAFVVLGYFFTVFALRFVLPAMSMEGKSFWFLLASPLKRVTLLRIKLLPLVTGLLIGGAAFSLLLTRLLNFQWTIGALSLVSLVGALCFIVPFTFAVGIWGINLRETDPSKLASSVGAIISTILIFAYLAIIVVLLAVPYNQYFQVQLEGGTNGTPSGPWVGGIVLLSGLVLGFVAWFAGRHRFERHDF